jgi:hypothetical protein
VSEHLREEQIRFLATLEIVRRELTHLLRSERKLGAASIDRRWVESLESDADAADTLEAFVSRYGRIQDTIAGKLLPRALRAVAEEPGTQLDNLARAERLGWIDSEAQWLDARGLRNRLIHEYMTDPDQFAEDIRAALECVALFHKAYEGFLALAGKQFGVAEDALAGYLHGR